MQDQTSSCSSDGREDKPTQRALLALVLHEFPRQLTKGGLHWQGFDYGGPVERAIQNLSIAGLLFCEGQAMVPTLPARHFHWLELA
jgi:hypothetical protein